MRMLISILMLVASNLFMTYAWYGHLRDLKGRPLVYAILISWGVAFFEYCLQVPANRIGFQVMSLAQLKIVQEVITMCVFGVFASLYMGERLRLDYVFAPPAMAGRISACDLVSTDLARRASDHLPLLAEFR